MDILCYYELNYKIVAQQKWNSFYRKIKRSNVNNTELVDIINKVGQLIKPEKTNKQILEKLIILLKIDDNDLLPVYKEDLYFLSVWAKQKIVGLKA